ncbi:MAG: beta-lactamase family protein [Armatimonadetes bacterium]|nr:beta-lactamase family protein [Armatimonadota bacterium]
MVRLSRRVALPLLLACIAAAQTGVTATLQSRQAKAEAFVKDRQKQLGIPGLSVAVVADGKLTWQQGFGFADLENKVAATPSTVYRLASISKSITSVAALRLWERGRLDLDVPIRTYVPTWPESQPAVSARQLMGHLGGVRHYKGREAESTRYYPTLTQALEIFRNDPLVAEPGTKYSYTTYGFTLLGCAMESAGEGTFESLLGNLVFGPAEMRSIRVDRVTDIIPNRAQGYAKGPNGQIENSGLADTSYKIPGGGLCSTAGDLAKFAIALMDGKLLKPETRTMMWTSQKTSDRKETGYGMGFGVGSIRGVKAVSHSGGQQRVSTYLLIIPSKRFAAAVMTNLEGADGASIARGLAEVYLPELKQPKPASRP